MLLDRLPVSESLDFAKKPVPLGPILCRFQDGKSQFAVQWEVHLCLKETRTTAGAKSGEQRRLRGKEKYHSQMPPTMLSLNCETKVRR